MFQSHRLITKSHPVNVVTCRCLTWQTVATLDTSFSGAPMSFEQGQTADIDTHHNYVFWSEYDTGGAGGNERGIVVTVDVTVPAASFITDELPLDLGAQSFITGIDGGSGQIWFLNLSSTSTLNKLDIVSDRDHPALTISINCDAIIENTVADGITIIGSPVDYYVAGDNGLQVFDISGFPTSIAVLSDATINIAGLGYRVSDKVLFANAIHDWGDGNDGAIIAYDMSTISSPVQVGILKTLGIGTPRAGIAVYGNYLYAIITDAFTNPVIGIFDITDPTTMTFIDYVYTTGTTKETARDIIAAGVCLWVFNHAGITGYDLLDPANPIKCGTGGSTGDGFQIGGLQAVSGTQETFPTKNKIHIMTP